MQCALKITCVFSVIIHQNIDPKSTENPATWRAARMHDFGISICCGQNQVRLESQVERECHGEVKGRSETIEGTNVTLRYFSGHGMQCKSTLNN